MQTRYILVPILSLLLLLSVTPTGATTMTAVSESVAEQTIRLQGQLNDTLHLAYQDETGFFVGTYTRADNQLATTKLSLDENPLGPYAFNAYQFEDDNTTLALVNFVPDENQTQETAKLYNFEDNQLINIYDLQGDLNQSSEFLSFQGHHYLAYQHGDSYRIQEFDTAQDALGPTIDFKQELNLSGYVTGLDVWQTADSLFAGFMTVRGRADGRPLSNTTLVKLNFVNDQLQITRQITYPGHTLAASWQGGESYHAIIMEYDPQTETYQRYLVYPQSDGTSMQVELSVLMSTPFFADSSTVLLKSGDDFCSYAVSDNLTQNWCTPLNGYSLGPDIISDGLSVAMTVLDGTNASIIEFDLNTVPNIGMVTMSTPPATTYRLAYDGVFLLSTIGMFICLSILIKYRSN